MPAQPPGVKAVFDYKYQATDWRADLQEPFQQTKRVSTQYVSDDGHLIRKIETTETFASAESTINNDPVTGPPYKFADGKFYANSPWIFQTTRIVTSSFEEISDTSYRVKIDDFDVLKNIHVFSEQIVDGKLPLTPTKSSALTSLVLRPIVGTLTHQCDWVPNTVPLDVPFAESQEDADKAAQRDHAIVRTLEAPMNPFRRRGHTIRLVDAVRMIDRLHMLTAVKRTISAETGLLKDVLTLEDWSGGGV